MQLLFINEILGEIEVVGKENFWITGEFTIYQNALKYKEFFSALVCEDGFDEEYYNHEWLDENNWYIMDNSKVIGIFISAVYEDGEILFRYREG